MNEPLSTWLAQLHADSERFYDDILTRIAAANLMHQQGYTLREIGMAVQRSPEWVRQHLFVNVGRQESGHVD